MTKLFLISCIVLIGSVFALPASNEQLDKATVHDVSINAVDKRIEAEIAANEEEKKKPTASIEISGISTGLDLPSDNAEHDTSNFKPQRAGSMFARFIDDIFQDNYGQKIASTRSYLPAIEAFVYIRVEISTPSFSYILATYADAAFRNQIKSLRTRAATVSSKLNIQLKSLSKRMSDFNVFNVINESDSQDFESPMLMSSAGYVAAAVTLLFIGFFGFFLNLFVIVLMCKDKKLWTPLNIILFNLVFSDFLVSIFGNPWTLISALSYHWIFGNVMCTMYGFFMSLLGIASISTLSVLAFERYLIVSRPFRNQSLDRRSAFYVVVAIWMYSLMLTIPPLLGWGKYVNEAANISCSVNWEEQTFNAMTYIIYLFAFGLVVPLTIITFSYLHIINTMKQSNLQMGSVTKAEGRVAYMVLVMIIAFLIAWSPYSVMALIVQFGDASVISPATAVFPALLAKSSICYNPIIYVGLNTQFRQSVKQWIGIRSRSRCTSETYAYGVSKAISQTTQDLVDDNNRKMKKQLIHLQMQSINASLAPDADESIRFSNVTMV